MANDKKKKKKRSPQEMHQQVQDALQALPHYVEQQKSEGKNVKAFMLRYVTGPVLRLMNKAFGAKRYRGTEGKKLQQTEKMRRMLKQKQTAMQQYEKILQDANKKKKTR